MSSEKEYILQGKYNRALNKIAQLEEQLARHTSVSLHKDSPDFQVEVERNDAALLQEELFRAQEKLQAALEERDATEKLSVQGLESGSFSRDKIRASALIDQIEECIVELKRELRG